MTNTRVGASNGDRVPFLFSRVASWRCVEAARVCRLGAPTTARAGACGYSRRIRELSAAGAFPGKKGSGSYGLHLSQTPKDISFSFSFAAFLSTDFDFISTRASLYLFGGPFLAFPLSFLISVSGSDENPTLRRSIALDSGRTPPPTVLSHTMPSASTLSSSTNRPRATVAL